MGCFPLVKWFRTFYGGSPRAPDNGQAPQAALLLPVRDDSQTVPIDSDEFELDNTSNQNIHACHCTTTLAGPDHAALSS